MRIYPTTLLLALLFTATNATASTHRTLHLLRGSEVASGAEAGYKENLYLCCWNSLGISRTKLSESNFYA